MKSEKILIVDDDLFIIELLSSILKNLGQISEDNIIAVQSGEECLEVAEDFQPDIIILDINMSGINGYETCRKIKSSPQTQAIPVIFLSDCQSLEDRLAAYAAGGIDYISKPFEQPEIIAKIRKHIEYKRIQAELVKKLEKKDKFVDEIKNKINETKYINNFLQNYQFCKDFDSLFNLFFSTTQQLKIRCVLKIEVPGEEHLHSDIGEPSILEKEIINMSSIKTPYISFGKGRFIIKSAHATLLIRQSSTDDETIKMLLNSLEMSIQLIFSKNKLLSKVLDYEKQNEIIHDEISDSYNLLNQDLKQEFLNLGVQVSLDPDEEDKLDDVVNKHHKYLNEKIAQLNLNHKSIYELLEEM